MACKWIERTFTYHGGRLLHTGQGPDPIRVNEWLYQLEVEEGYTVMDLHLAIAENGNVLAIVKVEEKS